MLILDVTEVKKIAGEKIYQRGLNYFKKNHVISMHLDTMADRVSGKISGTQTYSARINKRGQSLEGGCDCPASEGFDFCKHCVALALAYIDKQQNIEPHQLKNKEMLVKNYMELMDKSKLIDELLPHIQNDPAVFKQWQLRAEMQLSPMVAKDIKKKITQALPYKKHLWEYKKVSQYFMHAESMFDTLMPAIDQCTPEEQINLCLYSYQRLNKALEHIDDSGGFRFGLENILSALLLNSFTACQWKTNKQTKFIIELIKKSYDVFPQMPQLFTENQPELADAVFQSILKIWDALPDFSTSENDEFDNFRWYYILKQHAKDNNDKVLERDLLIKYAHSSHEYIELAQRFINEGDIEEAQVWIDKAKQAKNHPNQNNEIKLVQAQIYQRNKQPDEAIKLATEAFTASPSKYQFKQLLVFANQQGIEAEVITVQSEHALIEKFNNKETHYLGNIGNENLIAFYLYTEQNNKLFHFVKQQIVKQQQINTEQLFLVADLLLESEAHTAFDYFLIAISEEITSLQPRHYNQALIRLASIKESIQRFESSEYEGSFYTLLFLIKESFGRKRNLMKLLNQTYGTL